MNDCIKLTKLTKYYGTTRGIIDVDMQVKEGEIFGFIGPNGAGKSTTIRTILGLLHPTSGQIEIFGLDTKEHQTEILKDIGYLPSEVFYYENMKAIDLLHYSAKFYQKDCSERITYLAKILNLDLNKKIESMSLGNKKKVGIIQGLLHSPRLIILDEPTSGLDPLIQKNFFDLLLEENKNGATILFSSHILSEVQRICDRVAIIKEGKIIDLQEITTFREQKFSKVVIEGIENEIVLDGIVNSSFKDSAMEFLYQGDPNLLITALAKQKLTRITISEPSLEEIFMHHYE